MWTSDYEPFSYETLESVTVRDALEVLAGYLPYFERPGFILGAWVEAIEGPNEYVRLTPRGERFVRDLHSYRWIREFDWTGWHDSPRAGKLQDDDDPHALDEATPEELSRLLTSCMQLDAIQEGHLIDCCEKGWLTRILRRAPVLLHDLPRERLAEAMP